jgi:hypothetical protein
VPPSPLFAALASLALLAPVQAQEAPNHWPAVARTDLDFIYRNLQQNHPGAIDRQNPYFRQRMEEGIVAAREGADKAASLGDVKHVLKRYIAGFADGHLDLSFTHQSRSLTWPGLMVQRQNGRYVVTYRADGWRTALPALDAELVACDGRPAEALMREDVLPSVFNTTALESMKAAASDYLFIIDELAPHSQYRSCTFAGAGGEHPFALEWSRIGRSDYYNRWDQAYPVVERRTTIKQVAPGAFWVHLPVFDPNRAQEAELNEVTQRIPALRSAELIVFDVRANQGGNSQWGTDVLERLLGKPYLQDQAARRPNPGYSEWRVSPDNLRHVDATIVSLRQQFPNGASIIDEFTNVAHAMRAALASGQPFVRQRGNTATAAATPAEPPLAPLSRARLVLVTDSGCASSCLDFADAVLGLKGVRHYGQTTAADTLFMEVRAVDLPSRLGTLALAQKVYRGRARGNNEAYVPHVPYRGKIGDTAQLQAWVLEQERR